MSGDRTQAVADYIKEMGGYWEEHPAYPLTDWQYEVANGDTRLGYWEWVMQREDSDEVEDE